ncbi:hypothetical protein FACS189423_05360 [Bacteroidia bacterium]|nr:hypothetical protein FACS189423_05360 [Bacteroidia bacterium]
MNVTNNEKGYTIIPQQIPQEKRAGMNAKILSAIETGDQSVTPEMVYNCYTGLGGLHNLKQSDYDNYNEYARAKKEFEIGQFFTPHAVCGQMVELIQPKDSDQVLDICCGMGNFFNHLPNLSNAYGFDVDPDAVKVARYLYPDAHIETCDIRQYNPVQRFDVLIGNPPFNLDFNGTTSQLYYFLKAYEALHPAGLLIVIIPLTFLYSDFWDKSQAGIVNNKFSFIGQMALDSNAFSSVGVDDFKTKIMVFARAPANIEMNLYQLEAWENGDVERYSVKDFAERINDDIFQDMANWVCVIDVKKRHSEIYSLL